MDAASHHRGLTTQSRIGLVLPPTVSGENMRKIRARPPTILTGALLAAAVLGGSAACEGTAGTPAPAPAPAPAPPKLAPLAFAFTLVKNASEGTDVPSSYKVTYLAGTVVLRTTPRVLIGFRVDPGHEGDQSELLRENTDNAAAKGWP